MCLLGFIHWRNGQHISTPVPGAHEVSNVVQERGESVERSAFAYTAWTAINARTTRSDGTGYSNFSSSAACGGMRKTTAGEGPVSIKINGLLSAMYEITLLMVYVKFQNAGELMGEMLLSRPLAIFGETQGYLRQSDVPLDDIIVCATDGTALMLRRHR
ncbi:hypothetical protein M513_13081 [Trichuris suis]|uniref:Uncharacterized protein n=1 Tax=Trichuris suis TaxID=68888 RepID=A0A085LM45_9BILA|nr:hypothetical protein M513_13081 [Trichuris suis]